MKWLPFLLFSACQLAGTESISESTAALTPVAAVFASGQSAPTGIAVDANNAYWTNYGNGTVMKLPRGGGTPIPLATGQNAPYGITVDNANVYFTNIGDGTVKKIPIGGGAPTVLASGQNQPYGIAVDSTNLYVANAGGTVIAIPLSGGAVTTLASGQAGPFGLAVNGSNVYFTNRFGGTVMKVPIHGGALTQIAAGQGSPASIILNGNNVYWANYGAGTLMKAPLAGGAATTVASAQANPLGLALDANNLYWTNSSGGAVQKMPLGGGAPTPVVSAQNQPFFVAADAANVYWTDPANGLVRSTASSLPMGNAISGLPKDQWTWVDFPDSSCGDGSATGIGVYNSSTSQNLLIFMIGGGLCWDYTTCLSTDGPIHSLNGPYQKADFQVSIPAGLLPGTIFDRAPGSTNPFRDWSYVFVPYCTGDLHTGNNVAAYMNPTNGITMPYHHTGAANLAAFLKRLAPTFPAPPKVAVVGSSSGAFGAELNYPTFRAYWPGAKMYLLNDSGPLLETSDVPSSYMGEWFASWRLDLLLGPFCGDACLNDWSQFTAGLAAAWPQDRMALFSSIEDNAIAGIMLSPQPAFQSALYRMTVDRMLPTNNFRFFYIPGNTHMMWQMWWTPSLSVDTAAFWPWLNQFIGDDPAWSSQLLSN